MEIELVKLQQKVTDYKGKNKYIRTKDAKGIRWRRYASTEGLPLGLVEDHTSLESDYGIATLRNDFV